MKRFLKLSRQGEGGFTLIEIMVVVALLGILTAVVIPNVLNLRNEGEEEAKQTEWHNIQTAVYAIMLKARSSKLDAGTYPMTVQTEADCHGVKATDTTTNPDVTYYLDDHLINGEFPLQQAYDIALDGSVTIH